MVRKLVILALLPLWSLVVMQLAGCATGPVTQYQMMKEIPAERIASDRAGILRMTKPQGLPMFDDPVNSSIDEDDPMAVVKVGQTTFRTHYELYAFDGKQGRRFKAKLFSYCDCLGFRKFMMLPYIEVFDRHGNKVSSGASSLREKPPGFVDPFHIVGIWVGTLPADGIYFVMVAADNRCIGGSAGTVQGHGAPPLGMQMSAQHHPFGKYTLKFSMR